jgi:hypothetical protein
MSRGTTVLRFGGLERRYRASSNPSKLLLASRFGAYFDLSDGFSPLDFSQLRAEGVGMLLTHPLKERGSEGTCPLLL